MKQKMLLAWMIFFTSMPILVFSQNRQITGTVKNNTGNVVPSASVQQKGTTNGTAADANGQFTIMVTGNRPVLIISSVDFSPIELAVGAASSYDVVLQPSGNLGEVVVTAMGISKNRKALGYATQEVKSADLNINRQPNLVNALQGKVAGATISSIGGGPGQGASIRIRGINSIDIGQSNEPIFVIDGVLLDNSTSILGAGSSNNVRSVGNRASDINPDDIETINILKGGAATALYGLRGANGVVVITTKKGKGDGIRVNFNSSYGLDNVNKYPAVQQIYTAGILGVYTPIGLGPAWGPTIAEAKAGTGPGNVAPDPTHPDELFDNYGRAYKTGTQFRNTINVTGGTEAVKIYSSLSYFKQTGMLDFTDYKNISARVNTDIKISSKLKSSINFSYTNSGGYKYDADRFGESLAYFSGRWDVRDYLNTDGTQKWRGTNNPIYGAATNRLKDNVNRFVGGLSLGYSPLSWLNFTYRIGVDNYTDNRLRTAPGLMGIAGERSYDNAEGFVGEYNTNFRAINSTFMAVASTKIGKDFNATLRVGQDLYDRRVSSKGVLGSKLNVYNWYNLRNAAVLEASDNLSKYRLMGLFGEATFDYKNYLFLSVTGRNDVTSTLREPNNSFFYPSVSLSYIFSEHFKLPEVITSSKLRLSYAKIGKDAAPYSTSTGYAAYTSLPAGSTGFTRGSVLGDPNLRPEFTNTFEGGLEMNFFKNRLGFDFTYYHSISKDQIINVNVSSATGYVRAAVNSGSMRNKGVELVLKATPIKTDNFEWDINLNYSANRNKILSIREGLSEIPYAVHPGYGNAAVTMKLIPGEAYGNLYGTHYLRYYGSATPDPVRTDKSLPMVIGANGFPVLAPVSSQKLLGNSQPDWVGGLSNTLRYQRFTLSALFDARWGFEKYNRLENFFSAFGIADYTTDRRDFRIFDGVLADGSPNKKSVWLGQALGPDGVNYGEGYYRLYHRTISEPFVQDASWIRLRSLSLGYDIPVAKLFNDKFVRNVSVNLTGNNLWLHTNYFGLDPESVSADSGSNVDGFSGFTYPAARTFLFTLNVGF